MTNQDVTKESLLNKPQFLSVSDIEKMYDCCNDLAQKVIREIKSVSNRANLKGKVTISDYLAWYWLTEKD